MEGFPRYRSRSTDPRWNVGDVYGQTIIYKSDNPLSPLYEVEYARTNYTVGTWAVSTAPLMEKCWDELHKKTANLYLDGGPLTLRRCTNEDVQAEPVNSGKYRLPSTMYGYSGGWVTSVTPETFWPNALSLSDSVFDAQFEDCLDYGATGWSKARPGQPTADLAVFLAELRDLPRMLRDTAMFFKDSWNAMSKGAGSASKQAANTWLGANFGWLPFVSDMRKFAQTTQNLDRNIQQLRRDNGKWVKRRRTVSTTVETVYDSGWVNGSYHFPVLNTYWFQGAPYLVRRKTIDLNASFWFEARFRYWIPDIGSYRWKRKAIRKLYGLSLTPAVLWEATPWSWLVDWCSNVGDVISNLDNGLAENLVAKYAYIMGTQRLIGTVASQHNYKTSSGVPRDFISHFNLELKERKEASPFGFALSSDSFTARQWSLLSAIGLQRLKFS